MEFQWVAGDLRRIIATNRPGGGVARVGQARATIGLALLIELFAPLAADQHFAAHFESGGNGPVGVIQAQGNVAHGAQVGGYILAHAAIAAGRAAGKQTLLVEQ